MDHNIIDDDDLLPPSPESAAELREAIFPGVLAVHEAETQFNSERSRAGWWVGSVGAGISVISLFTVMAVVISHQPQLRYAVIDESTGVIHTTFGAKDAPDIFPERVIRHYITEYVGLRERFVWQLDPDTSHRVKLMSAPAEQTRYDEDRTKNNPGLVYGTAGYARIVRWLPNTFHRVGVGKDKTFEYSLHFVKGEVLAVAPNTPTESTWTVNIAFQLHPELAMDDQDRYDNEAGMMVIHYTSFKDN